MAEPWKQSGLVRGLGIPAPTGQYRVGCVDLMHQLPGDEQGLLVRLYYPTEATLQEGYNYAPWMPNKKYTKAFMEAEREPLPGLFSFISRLIINPKIPALEKAPLLQASTTPKGKEEGQSTTGSESTKAPPTFPVVVFSHGLKAMRTLYSGIACDVASHGYIVACVEHRDRSASASFQRVPKPSPMSAANGTEERQPLQDAWIEFEHFDSPDYKSNPVASAEVEYPFRNKQLRIRVDDVKKSLDLLTLLNQGGEVRNMMEGTFDFSQFKGRMNLEQAAVMGHSYGGGTTVMTLADDSRFKCGLALDSWMIPVGSEVYSDPASISQPLYFINTYTFQWKENMKRMLPLTRPVQEKGMSSCRVLTLDGTKHIDQCDAPLVVPKLFQSKKRHYEETPLDVETAHRVNLEICHAFLKRHLLKDSAYQQPVPDLDGTEGHSKHIIFGTNVDMTEKTDSSGREDAVPSDAALGPAGVQGDGENKEMLMVKEAEITVGKEKIVEEKALTTTGSCEEVKEIEVADWRTQEGEVEGPAEGTREEVEGATAEGTREEVEGATAEGTEKGGSKEKL